MGKFIALNPPMDGDTIESPAWREARQRLALYLQALELPESEAARLVEQALERARAEAPVIPLPAAMSALHQLLGDDGAAEPVALPPNARRPMVPMPLDRSVLGFVVDEVMVPVAAALRSLLSGPRRWQRLLGAVAAVAVSIGYQQIR